MNLDESVLLFHLKFDRVFSVIVSNRFKVLSEIITTLANDSCIGQLLRYGTPSRTSWSHPKPPNFIAKHLFFVTQMKIVKKIPKNTLSTVSPVRPGVVPMFKHVSVSIEIDSVND